jgi:hypothetical protein
LDEKAFRRLVPAFALCLGAEAHFGLADVRGLERQESVETLRWAARALVRIALEEANSS